METLLFWLFGATAVGAGLVSVSRKNAVASAVWLVVLFFGLAGTFVLLEAYFVAVVQILVYAGAIMVLFLFVIMLLDLRSDELRAHAGPKMRLPGILLSALFLLASVSVVRTAAEGEDAERVADRVSASLLLPAPPQDPSKPIAAVPIPAAPPPAFVDLVERRPVDLPLSKDLAARFAPARGGVPGGDLAPSRARTGTVPLDGKAVALVVALTPAGEATAWLDRDGDGAVSESEAVLPAGEPVRGEGGASVLLRLPLSAGADLPALEVAVRRGGLAAQPGGRPDGAPIAIGKALYDEWALPFEVTSVLLLGAIFGAVVLTKRKLS